MDLRGGNTIDGYRLHEQIGAGGFGGVWRATSMALGEEVAIKFLTEVSDARGVARFEREARALARVQHPNCVGFRAFRLAGAHPYIVTDLVRGETLREWMKQRHSVPEVLHVARQIVAALAAAHAVGVTHRDLKPENVLLTGSDASPTVKVLDFGLAKLTDEAQGDVTTTGEIFGTPGFMSPEQLRGRKDIGPSTDLYCFGVLLFELLEGKRPFDGASALEISMKHLMEPPPEMSPAIPEDLRRLVAQLLQKLPEQRPKDAASVLGALGAESGRALGIGKLSLVAAMLLIAIGIAAAGIAALSRTPPSDVNLPAKRAASAPVMQTSDVARPAPIPAPAPEPKPVRVSAGCGKPHQSGLQKLSVASGLDISSVLTYVPKGYDPGRGYPALVMFYEYKQGRTVADGPAGIMDETNLFDLADEYGVVLIAPVAETNSFTDRALWDNAQTLSVAFSRALTVGDELCIDPARYAVFGHAEGGWAAHEIACEDPTVEAVVTDTFRFRPDQSCASKRATRYLMLEPSDHPRAPRAGVADPTFHASTYESHARISLADHIDMLRARNSCTGEGAAEQLRGGVCTTYTCEAELVVCEFDGAHHWSGFKLPPKFTFEFPPIEFQRRLVMMEFLYGPAPAP